jgi:hypothetical protein
MLEMGENERRKLFKKSGCLHVFFHGPSRAAAPRTYLAGFRQVQLEDSQTATSWQLMVDVSFPWPDVDGQMLVWNWVSS